MRSTATTRAGPKSWLASKREQADRPAADHHDGRAGRDARVLGRVEAGREDVGEKQDLLVVEIVGRRPQVEVGRRYAEQLRLRAGELGRDAVHLVEGSSGSRPDTRAGRCRSRRSRRTPGTMTRWPLRKR